MDKKIRDFRGYREYLLNLPEELECERWDYKFYEETMKEDNEMWIETQPYYEEYEELFKE